MVEGDEKSKKRRMKPLLLYEELLLGGSHTQGQIAAAARGVRYTCMDVCTRFLACGASTGSVYVFARSQKKQQQMNSSSVQFRLLKMVSPPSSDRVPVSCVSFCPQQRFLVVGTSKGAVYAISLQDPARIGEKIEFSHSYHAGFAVTYLLWDKAGARVFSACSSGTVAQTTIRAGMSVIFGATNTELLLKEETGIVQLDIAMYRNQDLLLVSSQTRVLILELNAANTSGGNGVVQVG